MHRTANVSHVDTPEQLERPTTLLAPRLSLALGSTPFISSGMSDEIINAVMPSSTASGRRIHSLLPRPQFSVADLTRLTDRYTALASLEHTNLNHSELAYLSGSDNLHNAASLSSSRAPSPDQDTTRNRVGFSSPKSSSNAAHIDIGNSVGNVLSLLELLDKNDTDMAQEVSRVQNAINALKRELQLCKTESGLAMGKILASSESAGSPKTN